MHSNGSTKCYTYIGIIYIVLKFYSNHSDTIGLWLHVPQTRQSCESVTQRLEGGDAYRRHVTAECDDAGNVGVDAAPKPSLARHS